VRCAGPDPWEPRGANPVAHSDEELRKRLLPLAVAGVPIVLIDNIAGEFGSEAMEMVLTSNTFRDRKLGVSEDSGDVPWRSVMIAEPSTAPAGSAERVGDAAAER
jgi:hypothetical protein